VTDRVPTLRLASLGDEQPVAEVEALAPAQVRVTRLPAARPEVVGQARDSALEVLGRDLPE
jgi:hypothetical protein